MNALNFVTLAFEDYIAARLLLNNNFAQQGATLASSALEKYFKALLCGLDVKFRKIHLDKLSEIKSLFAKTDYSILFNHLDENFLFTLSQAYKFRYYDNIKGSDSFGFFVNQLLGELDFSIDLIESLMTFNDDNGIIHTAYKRAVVEQNENLLLNNYVLNKIEKIDFMQQKSQAYGLYFDPEKEMPVVVNLVQPLQVPYNGKISLINIDEDKSKQQ